MSARTLDAAWRQRRNNFNLIRLVAAWLVIWSHAWPITGTPGSDPIGRVIGRTAGMVAVDVFFVISGFLVAASFERNRPGGFLLARALRIYPALIVCVALSVFVLGPLLTTHGGYWTDSTTWRYLWANATLWRAEFSLPGVFDTLPRTTVNGSLWTLPIEARLYLALLIAGLLGMLRPKRYLPAWILVIAAACAYAWLRRPLPEHLQELCWLSAFFITGTLLWTWRARIVLHYAPLLPLVVAVVLASGSIWFIPTYFVLAVYGTFCLAFLPKLPVIRRNDLSYGLYLYGWPAQQCTLLMGATTVASNTLFGTAFAAAFAAASWLLVERPALAWKRQFVARIPGTALADADERPDTSR